MTPEFAYLLKVNVAFVLFYAFYRLFFYKDTFFKLRRAILLAFFGLALFYPLLNAVSGCEAPVWETIGALKEIRAELQPKRSEALFCFKFYP